MIESAALLAVLFRNLRRVIRLDAANSETIGYLQPYSTVTLLARFRGLSTSQPRSTAQW
jgi:hypothetical protein